MTAARKRWHVKHQGWETELQIIEIANAIGYIPPDRRQEVVDALAPAPLRRAVASVLDMETT